MTLLLLSGGTAIIHDAKGHVKCIRTDILLTDNRISEIQPSINPPNDSEIIDCTGKLICPGFIDTHHHLWQTQLKGRHANQTLVEFFSSGDLQAASYTLEDIFWGQLAGCLETLVAGTTTVVDHAHLNYEKRSSTIAISATVSSGIRSIFCYSPTSKLVSWSPFQIDPDLLKPWVLETLTELGNSAPFGENGRVQLGLGFDGYFLPKEVIISLFAQAEKLGIKHITSHYVRNAQYALSSLPELLDSYGLLDEKILLSHASGATQTDVELLTRANAHVSSTPSTEIQMGMGMPLCFREDVSEFQQQCSLGIDCHSNNAGSIPSEMRLALQAARGLSNQKYIDHGKAPKTLQTKVEDAFNLGTILGARAIGMEKEIGSLEVGKLADLVIFDALSPAMIGAASQDPLAAIVLHSSPADIAWVIIDGKIRKSTSGILPVQVDRGAKQIAGKDFLDWPAIAEKLLKSKESIDQKIKDIDFGEARSGVLKEFQINEANLV